MRHIHGLQLCRSNSGIFQDLLTPSCLSAPSSSQEKRGRLDNDQASAPHCQGLRRCFYIARLYPLRGEMIEKKKYGTALIILHAARASARSLDTFQECFRQVSAVTKVAHALFELQRMHWLRGGWTAWVKDERD